jgi:hypothetical protein
MLYLKNGIPGCGWNTRIDKPAKFTKQNPGKTRNIFEKTPQNKLSYFKAKIEKFEKNENLRKKGICNWSLRQIWNKSTHGQSPNYFASHSKFVQAEVNFTNILWAHSCAIFLRQESSNLKYKYKKALR